MNFLPLSQSRPYAETLTTLGADVHWQDQVLTIRRRLPVLGRLTYVPRALPPQISGPTLINAPDQASDAHLSEAGLIPLITPQSLALLDLRPDAELRLAAQHGKWRNRLRRAQAARLVLTETRFDPDRHEWLLQKETAQRRQHRYSGLPHMFTCSYPAARTLLVQALSKRQPIAAMLFLLHPPGATYHIGWCGPEGRRLNAHPLILWHASDILRTRGIQMIDLGLLDTQTAPDLARFKLGSGARALGLGHTWLHLPRLSPLVGTIRRGVGFPSGLLSKGSIGGPRTSQGTPYGSAQHRHHRPR